MPAYQDLGARFRRLYALRNDHLQYAITRYALAAALVAIYLIFHLRRR